jgi:hypothetical protein
MTIEQFEEIARINQCRKTAKKNSSKISAQNRREARCGPMRFDAALQHRRVGVIAPTFQA